jgi:hypothetical protein
VALITRGWVAPTPDDIALVRILGPTMVPSLAGLLLMFGSTLRAPRTAPQSPGGKKFAHEQVEAGDRAGRAIMRRLLRKRRGY